MNGFDATLQRVAGRFKALGRSRTEDVSELSRLATDAVRLVLRSYRSGVLVVLSNDAAQPRYNDDRRLFVSSRESLTCDCPPSPSRVLLRLLY